MINKIGDTPKHLGSCLTADALMIDGNIVTKSDYSALIAERDALAAQVEVLKQTLINVKDSHCRDPYKSTAEERSNDGKLLSSISDLVKATPAACLAQVKADEVLESASAMASLYNPEVGSDWTNGANFIVRHLIQRSERIRQGASND